MQDKNSNQPCVKVKGQRTSTESVDNRDDLDRSEDSRMEIFQWLEKLNLRSDLIWFLIERRDEQALEAKRETGETTFVQSEAEAEEWLARSG